jgi:hypothetical protein
MAFKLTLSFTDPLGIALPLNFVSHFNAEQESSFFLGKIIIKENIFNFPRNPCLESSTTGHFSALKQTK